jgi:hypothetical protein
MNARDLRVKQRVLLIQLAKQKPTSNTATSAEPSDSPRSLDEKSLRAEFSKHGALEMVAVLQGTPTATITFEREEAIDACLSCCATPGDGGKVHQKGKWIRYLSSAPRLGGNGSSLGHEGGPQAGVGVYRVRIPVARPPPLGPASGRCFGRKEETRWLLHERFLALTAQDGGSLDGADVFAMLVGSVLDEAAEGSRGSSGGGGGDRGVDSTAIGLVGGASLGGAVLKAARPSEDALMSLYSQGCFASGGDGPGDPGDAITRAPDSRIDFYEFLELFSLTLEHLAKEAAREAGGGEAVAGGATAAESMSASSQGAGLPLPAVRRPLAFDEGSSEPQPSNAESTQLPPHSSQRHELGSQKHLQSPLRPESAGDSGSVMENGTYFDDEFAPPHFAGRLLTSNTSKLATVPPSPPKTASSQLNCLNLLSPQKLVMNCSLSSDLPISPSAAFSSFLSPRRAGVVDRHCPLCAPVEQWLLGQRGGQVLC